MNVRTFNDGNHTTFTTVTFFIGQYLSLIHIFIKCFSKIMEKSTCLHGIYLLLSILLVTLFIGCDSNKKIEKGKMCIRDRC